MRSKLDLGDHKMAGVYRQYAPASRWKRTWIRKPRDDQYLRIWRLVDGGVRDAFANHPEYLTEKGKEMAVAAVVKRVTGTLYGHATQVVRGRPVNQKAPSGNTAADKTGAQDMPSLWTRLVSVVVSWASAVGRSPGGDAASTFPPKIHGGQ